VQRRGPNVFRELLEPAGSATAASACCFQPRWRAGGTQSQARQTTTALARIVEALLRERRTVNPLLVPARYNFLHTSSRPALRAGGRLRRPSSRRLDPGLRLVTASEDAGLLLGSNV
jgi:hypothetical protein